MKKLLLVITAIFLILPLSAFEWGGLITEDFKYQYNNSSSFRQSNNVALWMNLPITNDASYYFAGQASIKYFYDINSQNGNQFMPVADVDLAKLAGRASVKNSVVSIAAGRYAISDLSRKIFNQNCDGMSLKIAVPGSEYSLYAGYTGMLNSLNVTMLGENGIAHEAASSVYSKAHDYIPLLLEMEIPSAFLNQAINAQISMFYDLEATKYNRFYFTAGMNGPVAGPLYYALSATLGSSTFKNFYAYGNLSLQAFISSFTVKVTGEYASGNQFGLSPFTTFTSNTAYNSLLSPELSGVILPGIDIAYTVGGLYTSLAGKFVLGFPESDVIVKGVNAAGNLVINLFSDLKTSLSGIYYYDIEGSGELNNMSVALNISLSF